MQHILGFHAATELLQRVCGSKTGQLLFKDVDQPIGVNADPIQ